MSPDKPPAIHRGRPEFAVSRRRGGWFDSLVYGSERRGKDHTESRGARPATAKRPSSGVAGWRLAPPEFVQRSWLQQGRPRRKRAAHRLRRSFAARNGIIVLVPPFSYRAIREEIRARIGNFIEVYVNAPLDVCEQRDRKGLYRKARAGQLSGFTGVDDPYEIPLSPEIECHTDRETIDESADKIMRYLGKSAASKTPRASSSTVFFLPNIVGIFGVKGAIV